MASRLLATLAHLTSHQYGYMVSHMKTTVDLPDALLIEAKKRAAELRRPLRELIAEGLRAVLRGETGRPARRPIRWITVEGALSADLDLGDREAMHEFLRPMP